MIIRQPEGSFTAEQHTDTGSHVALLLIYCELLCTERPLIYIDDDTAWAVKCWLACHSLTLSVCVFGFQCSCSFFILSFSHLPKARASGSIFELCQWSRPEALRLQWLPHGAFYLFYFWFAICVCLISQSFIATNTELYSLVPSHLDVILIFSFSLNNVSLAAKSSIASSFCKNAKSYFWWNRFL